ncbi:pimeloyl-ACP methyl ester esterase BioH [Buttiauxella warmboldiae]|uniref:Pimeloyl-[acyl-carrier protein] methyl ester esterase n=1 Tax=Buttiauxella warmboldiae TaxID=82993 RepID=A0A3N5DZ38_9ENTR|nr:pimeloyl-ACP methyl ester esterase BioH [Buttiauxella warmboldiae]RPH22558.1 pimeloyl-ACP methyl ester esterase BioH [Buttiauxella warmboldiae]
MSKLWWQTKGEGQHDLVLLHGWGLNAEVWHCISDGLSSHFRLHFVDLPGYGRSQGFGALTLEEMAEAVLAQAPERAMWLGWSLGGLVASQVALSQPQRVTALITVASSPCFTAQNDWPGIKPDILAGFQQQLSEDFQRTVERFLALQTLGTETARQDARRLKAVVLEQPVPSVEVLNGGLEILKTADLREPLSHLALPFLRLYGHLDGLVPRNIAGLLDERWPQSESVIFPKAAHAPFISHPADVCQLLEAFQKRMKD